MNRIDIIRNHQEKLNDRYKELVEQAYNLRETDHALSDISEYNAMKLLDELNKLKYLSGETTQSFS
jgi:hypothetical protein